MRDRGDEAEREGGQAEKPENDEEEREAELADAAPRLPRCLTATSSRPHEQTSVAPASWSRLRPALAEWLADHGRSADADPLLDGAGEAFERLEAAPWLDRVAELRQTVGATSTGSLVG